MCGRYVIARAVGDLVAATGAVPDESLGGGDETALRANWNTAPTTDVPIVLERLAGEGDDAGRVRELHVARWGLVPGWAKDPAVGAKMFNARSETVLEKPSFRKAVRARRCAVPANGYYEWKKAPGPGRGGRKQPYYVHPADPEETIWFAGIYEWWRVPEGAEPDSGALQPGRGGTGSWLLSCSVLTTDAPEPSAEHPVLTQLHELHDRMPIPLAPEHLDDWLRPGEEEAPQLVDLVRAEASRVAARWVLDPVDPAVGNVRNNSPELVVPQQELF
ncbi:SOS response-associated peptidase [Kocuria sp. LUK]|uniref:SOS response-associated peptidase n=1 Tax=Kocuria TaxID=57493 RepID=UPI001E3F0DDE|nr:SOS response-associated peptidase [Kocuria sp. LUK]MCD1143699.1 SOS response-associated peptidase [Kocuria sp. LUK]